MQICSIKNNKMFTLMKSADLFCVKSNLIGDFDLDISLAEGVSAYCYGSL